jgi:hypothetical protein
LRTEAFPPPGKPAPARVFSQRCIADLLQLYPPEQHADVRRILETGDVPLLVFYLWLLDPNHDVRTEAEVDAYLRDHGFMTPERRRSRP